MDPDPHYIAIQSHYDRQAAQRSGVDYMQHIDGGLRVLDALGATLSAKRGFCLHPIVQADADLVTAFCEGAVLRSLSIDAYALMLATEYRSVANAYLSHRTINKITDIRLSPLEEVNQMLIADKVHNRKDFELHHVKSHERSSQLSQYFNNWLRRLAISEERYRELAAISHGGT